MSPSQPRRLVLPALLLTLAAVTLIFWKTATSEHAPLDVFTQEAIDLEGATALDENGGEHKKGVVERTDAQPLLAESSADAALLHAQEHPVKVRAEIRTKEDVIGSAPINAEGWIVIAQTWDSDTATTPRFEAVTNKKGVAELEFPHDVHIDWVTCLPPKESGYGFTFVEEHVDLYLGDSYLAVLPLHPARTAFGRVVDQDSKPVAGAVVHAFDESWTYGLHDWTPGFLTSTTDSSGRFNFSALQDGNWVLAVEPIDWLMVNPALGDQRDSLGTAYFGNEETAAVDVGTLQCIPISSVSLTVTDSAGTRIQGARVHVEPITYDADYLVPTSHDQELSPDGWDERWESRIPVGDYREEFLADDQGQVDLRVVRGRWKIWIDPLPGMDPEGSEIPELEFHTDQKSLHYRLPVVLHTLSGRTLDPEGNPLSALVSFSWKRSNNVQDFDLVTDPSGQFEFQGLLVFGGYTATAWTENGDWLPHAWLLSTSELSEPLNLTLQPATSLSLRFTQMREPPISAPFGVMKLKTWIPESGEEAAIDAYWWNLKRYVNYTVTPDRTMTLSGLAPGKYEISLQLPEPGYQSKSGTAAVMSERQRWTVEAGPETHTLAIGE